MAAWRLAAGTACGSAAFVARDWEYDSTGFLAWTLVALAGNFYTTVLTDLFTSRAPAPAPASSPAPVSAPVPVPVPAAVDPVVVALRQRLAASLVSLVVCLIVAYTAQRAIIGMYSVEYQRHGEQTLKAFGAWAVAMVILVGVPWVAARLARAATHTLLALRGLPLGPGPGTTALGHLAAVALAAATLFLGWQSIGNGIDEACAQGTYPFGCPDRPLPGG